jgi:hypothetical protein
MREESHQSFPPSNPIESFYAYVKSQLEKAGINPQKISIDGTIITDKKVPKKIMSDLREHATDHGITLKFLTSG